MDDTRLKFEAYPEHGRRVVVLWASTMAEARANLARACGCEKKALAYRLAAVNVCTAAIDDADDLGLSVLDVFDMRAEGGERIREALAKAGARGGKKFSRVAEIKNWRIETMAKKKDLPKEVSEYMAELGRRGGAAGKGRAAAGATARARCNTRAAATCAGARARTAATALPTGSGEAWHGHVRGGQAGDRGGLHDRPTHAIVATCAGCR